ncbi:SRPBCC family protein [Bdellovibrio sp. SKB1291214]|uniref:SRPBCC family protein n=1 Tax=Bdellovibrio sp. SKB1291214 TaxID=1732569 RepID=UPI000B51A0DB|nr:SRPBCC family protein [Bdellovibrio sp. SKB1291214]UYL08561.1 SRPBCC family protein [Bdellovibrio sp. SKB1291214]
MAKKIAIGIVVFVVLFLGYVSTRSGSFRYENSTVINASSDKIFPYLSNLKKGGQWNPYEQADPNMVKNFSGTDGAVGSKMEFKGNKDAGAGSLEILEIKPNEFAKLKLIMTEPMHGEQLIEYSLTPEGQGTKFTWTMHGEGGFMTKLMTVLIDCEKMFRTQMDKGFENLKKVVEAPAGSAEAAPSATPAAEASPAK